METIQVVLTAKLRRAADVAARRQGISRSALVRNALVEYLERQHVRDLEEQERLAYLAMPDDDEELRDWEAIPLGQKTEQYP